MNRLLIVVCAALAAMTTSAAEQLASAVPYEKGGFRHATLPDWPETPLDLGPIQMAVAKEASTRCATKLAGSPLDLGEAESFASKFATNAAGAAVSKALSSALGGFLGGGGGSEKKPPLFKDQVKKSQKVDFTDAATDTRIKLGGLMAQDGMLLSARVDKADGKGTFHTVFLERPDCVRIFPVKQMGYELWGKWTLNVSITKTTSHYQDGVLTSQTVEKSGLANGDVKSLSQISGVGKKTAERIVVELRDKIGAAGAWEASSAARSLSAPDQKVNDAVLALMALGFKQVDAHDTVRSAQAVLGQDATVEELVRASLKKGA